MVKIEWMITDPIKGVELKEFDTVWNGIFGYFQIRMNDRVLGFCPDRELLDGEEGNEDILHWFTQLSDGIIQLNTCQEYEIQLLSMNMAKIILKNNDNLRISFVNTNTDEVIWSEKVIAQEWHDEVKWNIERFMKEVQEGNSILLGSNLMQKLIKRKETMEQVIKF